MFGQNSGAVVTGLITVIIIGIVIVWASLGEQQTRESIAREQSELQFDLSVAEICVSTGVLSISPDARTQDRVQALVNDCLAQVRAPVRINVPENENTDVTDVTAPAESSSDSPRLSVTSGD